MIVPESSAVSVSTVEAVWPETLTSVFSPAGSNPASSGNSTPACQVYEIGDKVLKSRRRYFDRYKNQVAGLSPVVALVV